MSSGYLVVLRVPEIVPRSHNPRYRGLYRTRPFYMEEYEQGFDDPYFGSNYSDSENLIQDRSVITEFIKQYAPVEDPEAFEAIYVRTYQDNQSMNGEKPNFPFLGFDVAGVSPFWSIVADCPPPSDSRFSIYLGQLNEYGLFSTARIAREYLEAYFAEFPERRSPMHIWQVYLAG